MGVGVCVCVLDTFRANLYFIATKTLKNNFIYVNEIRFDFTYIKMYVFCLWVNPMKLWQSKAVELAPQTHIRLQTFHLNIRMAVGLRVSLTESVWVQKQFFFCCCCCLQFLFKFKFFLHFNAFEYFTVCAQQINKFVFAKILNIVFFYPTNFAQ